VVAELADDEETAVLAPFDVVAVPFAFAVVATFVDCADATGVDAAVVAVLVDNPARAPVMPAKLARLAKSAILRPPRARWTRRRRG
jgi:hypothetical protein